MFVRFSLTVWVLAILSALGAAQNVPVVGHKIAAGAAVPLRKNINAFYQEGGPQWNLYVRSLVDFYGQPHTSSSSFFQIAGIHGRPFIEWNGAGGRQGDGWLGYCPHGEKLFLSWHRPYLVLFEQRLVQIAQRLAREYPANVRDSYIQAANTLRAPFWDWASDSNVPRASEPTTLRVRGPNGDITVENPLRIYKFPQAAINQQYGSFARDTQIYKCRNPNSYPNTANSLMGRRPYRQWVYDAFTRSTDFGMFASTSSSGTSLEQIHNAVHWDGSCGFQFLNADYSAFDPLFMLHHAQMDRLWAYWQFIKPAHATWGAAYNSQSRWATRGGTNIGPNTPLQPFYRSTGVFHTSNTVQSIKTFGYTYEGLEFWRKSDAQMGTDATALINRLYGSGAVRAGLKKRDGTPEETTRYFAQVSVDLEQLERPCEIGLYANVTNVGNWIVLGQPSEGKFFGKFSLDKAADPVELRDEKTQNVVGDLLASLRVEIRKHDGTLIPLASVPSLKLELENVDVVAPETVLDLPEYKDSEQRTAPKKSLTGTPVA